MKKLKLFMAAFALLLGWSNAQADVDITAYLGNFESYANGGWADPCQNNHGSTDDGAWWNTQTLPEAGHSFRLMSGAYESWTPTAGKKGVVMGRTITLPAGSYNLSFKAVGTSQSGNTTANDVVAFCTGKDNISISTTGEKDYTTRYDVSFDFDVTTDSKTIQFGIEKLSDESTYNWFTMTDITLTLKTSATDNTNLITNPDFSEETWNTGWSGTGDTKAAAFVKQSGSGSFNGNFAEMWGKLSAGDLNQTLSSLPAGIYQLMAKVNAGTTCYLYASIGDKVQQHACLSGLGVQNLTFVVNETSNVKIGLKHNGTSSSGIWVAVDGFKLLRVGDVGTADLTTQIINPSFESDFTGWTNSGMAAQDNSDFGKNGSKYAEAWQPNGTKSVSQTISGLPLGVYRISAHSKARLVTSAKIYAGTKEKAITIADSENDYNVDFACDGNNDVTIGFQGVGTGAGTSWLCVDNFKLSQIGTPIEAAEMIWQDAYNDAVSARDNAAYENVVGAERTALNTEIAKEEPTTAEGYVTATQSLSTATSNFIAAAPNYVLLATEKTKAENLGLSAAAIAEVTPLTKTGLKALQDLKVAEYNYVTTTYPYAVALGEWTSTGTNTSAADFSNEHWSGTTHSYKNQNDNDGQGWNANSWSINFSQDVLLPAGTYVFKVAGRQASGDQVTTSLVVKKGEEELGSVNDFPRSNNSRGINKSGATAFEGEASEFANGGNGFGWEWRYVKFTLAEEATVNIAINSVATAIHQWVSFGDYTLQADNDDVVDILAYNVAKASAITVRDDAQYVNVTGSERTALVNAINADPSSDYPAATAALNEATTAFTGAKTSYDNFVTAKAAEYEDNLPYASSAKFAAIGTAQAAADATSASDAEAKTNAIISAYRKYVESNALAEGVGGIDKTNLISDANFSGVTIVDQTAGAWAFSQTGGTAAILSGESFTDGDGNASYSYFDYNNGGANNQNLSQTLTALPKGQYLLTVTARATSAMDGNYYLSVDFDETSAKQAIPAIGNTGGTFGRGWNDVSVVFNHVSDGDVTIHVYGQNGKAGWSGATRFRLAKIDKVATIGSTGWTTFSSPYALNLSSMTASAGDVAAYYASATSDESVTVLPIESSAVQAGEGLLLKGTPNATITIPVVASGSAIDGNLMVGCPTATNITSSTPNYETCYVLGIESEKAVFQNVKKYIDENGTLTIPAGKAYLNATSSNGARALRISFGGITGVENVEAAAEVAKKNGAYLENGKIAIYKNGMKFSATGAKLK